MLLKKLNSCIFPIALVSLVVIFSCNPNEVEDAAATRRDTLTNWLTVNITFQPTASARLREEYLTEVKQFLSNYINSASDSSRHLQFSPSLSQSTKDSLRFSISVDVDRLHLLKDSVSDPRPPCPPRPGPRTIADAILELQCALEE